MLRSRSFMRLTMRVDLPHLGQSVLLLVSMTFLRSAVFAIFAPTAIFISPDLFQYVRSDPPVFSRGWCGWDVSGRPNLKYLESTPEELQLRLASIPLVLRGLFYRKGAPAVLLSGHALTDFPGACYRHMFAL